MYFFSHRINIKLTAAADIVHSALSFQSYPIEKHSSTAAGDVEGLGVTRLNYKVKNITVYLSPQRGATAIWKYII